MKKNNCNKLLFYKGKEINFEEPVTQAIQYYAWEDWGTGPVCAWCHKPRRLIQDENKHLATHNKESSLGTLWAKWNKALTNEELKQHRTQRS